MGIKIIDVKIVGICSKHRNENTDKEFIPKRKDGTIYGDEDVCCFDCDLT